MDTDTSELVPLGEKILDIGNQLKELRGQRDAILSRIAVLEAELTPLIARHAKIIADVAGISVAPVAPPVLSNSNSPDLGFRGPMGPPGPNGPQRVDEKEVRAKVLRYLDDAEPGASALDVANALRLDPVIVRQVMADLMRGR